MKNLFALLIIVTLFPFQAKAQPIEISADNALEWHREKQQYIAKGNAIATQNDTQIQANTLTAHYSSDTGEKSEITKIIAEGNVTITNPDGVITGENGIYIVADEHATLTGETLKLTGEKTNVEASESFEYWAGTQKFTAKGNAKITEENRTLTSDEVTAWFTPKEDTNTANTNGLKEAEAIGNVIITTDTDTAYGDTGHYDGIQEIATLKGNVKLHRDKNILNGDRAVVNLKTGISQLFSDSKSGRVTGKFFPNSKK